METKVLQPADKMTTAQCVIECSGYLRTIASQEFEGEDWQTAPKLRRQNLLTDFLCNLELSGEEFAELCGLIGFQLSKTTTAKLAKFTVIAYDWQSEANGEATADILAALDKCEGVALIEERGYHPQARTYDYLRFHIAAFWRCLVNELRSLCLGVGLVVYPKEIPATPTETPQISTEAAETVNVSAEGEKGAERAENKPKRKIQYFHYTPEQLKRYIIDVYEKRANGEWVLLPYAQIDTDAGLWDVVDGKIGWWTNWRREEFSEMNMDFNSPTCGRCCKINRTYQTDNYVISNEKLLEFTFNGDYYYIQRQIYSKGGIKECYTIMDALGDFSVNDYSDTLEGIMRRFDKCYKGTATIIWQASETPTEQPQSPEIPQTIECATDAPKPRENAA